MTDAGAFVDVISYVYTSSEHIETLQDSIPTQTILWRNGERPSEIPHGGCQADAVIHHSRGSAVDHPCDACAAGNGPFEDCVRFEDASGDFPCTNCQWSGQNCSFICIPGGGDTTAATMTTATTALATMNTTATATTNNHINNATAAPQPGPSGRPNPFSDHEFFKLPENINVHDPVQIRKAIRELDAMKTKLLARAEQLEDLDTWW